MNEVTVNPLKFKAFQVPFKIPRPTFMAKTIAQSQQSTKSISSFYTGVVLHKLLSTNSFTECTLCKKRKGDRLFFPNNMNHSLFGKYSQSQNYFYMRDINDFLQKKKNKRTILIKDEITFFENSERLSRFYLKNEYRKKLKMLTKYYKFHNDLPRIFQKKFASRMFYYHNKRRRANLKNVQLRIREELKLENQSLKNMNLSKLEETDREILEIRKSCLEGEQILHNFPSA